MAGEYRQFREGDGEARRRLWQRLARKEIGDAAYDEAASFSGDRAFRRFGVVFIVAVAVTMLGL